MRHLFVSLLVLGFLLAWTGTYALPAGLVLMPYVGPGLYVHGQYYLRNRHTRVAVLAARLEVTQDGATRVVPYGEIEAVELHAGGWVYRQTDRENNAFQSYHYLQTRCHNHTNWLTSLLVCAPLEKAFAHLLAATAGRYTRHKRFLASTRD